MNKFNINGAIFDKNKIEFHQIKSTLGSSIYFLLILLIIMLSPFIYIYFGGDGNLKSKIINYFYMPELNYEGVFNSILKMIRLMFWIFWCYAISCILEELLTSKDHYLKIVFKNGKVIKSKLCTKDTAIAASDFLEKNSENLPRKYSDNLRFKHYSIGYDEAESIISWQYEKHPYFNSIIFAVGYTIFYLYVFSTFVHQKYMFNQTIDFIINSLFSVILIGGLIYIWVCGGVYRISLHSWNKGLLSMQTLGPMSYVDAVSNFEKLMAEEKRARKKEYDSALDET